MTMRQWVLLVLFLLGVFPGNVVVLRHDQELNPEYGRKMKVTEHTFRGKDGIWRKFLVTIFGKQVFGSDYPERHSIAESFVETTVTPEHSRQKRATPDPNAMYSKLKRAGGYQDSPGWESYVSWPKKLGEWTSNFAGGGPKCPIFKDPLSVHSRSEILIHMQRPSHPEGIFVQGYLCEAQSWMSRCKETWYFSYEETQKVEKQTAELEKCHEAIRLLEEGNPVIPRYPLALCYWNADHTETIVYHTVTRHTAALNPYTSHLVDPVMLRGNCALNSTACPTSHASVLWIKDSHHSDHTVCTKEDWEDYEMSVHLTGLQVAGNKWETVHLLEGEGIGTKVLEKSCKMCFCGTTGIRFDDSEWWTFKGYTQSQKGGAEIRFKDVMEGLPDCDQRKSKEIGISHPHFSESYGRKEVGNMLRALQCNNAIGKLMEGEHLTPIDISSLAQEKPGLGLMYRLHRDKSGFFDLQWAHANYSLILYKPDPLLNSIGLDYLQNPVTLDEWVTSDIPGIQIGVNGIIRRIDKNKTLEILAPQIMLQMGELSPEFAKKIAVKRIDWIDDKGESNIIDDDGVDIPRGELDRTNVVDGVRNWVEKVRDTISGWTSGIKAVLGTAVLIVMVVILWRVVMICKAIKCKSGNASKTNDSAESLFVPKTSDHRLAKMFG
ncbi:glycoprotein [Aruac virus]|uniref:Glycoprotein n=1 Tax=Aruac virus TaxID=1272961 RepID=A0A0D3R143_9RHAB|nr:glycoprotein [Aruac virus]AJR28311.1 glycoprotein [Aruac virus]